jgi:hypothetical protein
MFMALPSRVPAKISRTIHGVNPTLAKAKPTTPKKTKPANAASKENKRTITSVLWWKYIVYRLNKLTCLKGAVG